MKKSIIAATMIFASITAQADTSNVTLIVHSESTMTQGIWPWFWQIGC